MTDYFVDAIAGSDKNTGKSEANAWKTLAKVAGYTFAAGDTVSLKCGCTWDGQIILKTARHTGIILKSYGIGTAPIFSYSAAPSKWHRAFEIEASSVTFDGLRFANGVMPMMGAYVYGTGCTFHNCEFTQCAYGVTLEGSGNRITQCNFHDLIGDDAAIAVENYGSSNEIDHCRMIRCLAPSIQYGLNGGALELYGSFSNVVFHHNWVEGCEGVVEVGSDSGGIQSSIRMHHNVLVNNGSVAWFNLDGPFKVGISDFCFDHNTIVETIEGRHSMIGFSAIPKAGTFKACNNIFYIAVPMPVFNRQADHNNNLFYLANGATLGGITLDKTEKLSDPLFVGLANLDLHLSDNSPAVNAGADLGYTADYDGKSMFGLPDLGAFENQKVTPVRRVAFYAKGADAQARAVVIDATGETVRSVSWTAIDANLGAAQSALASSMNIPSILLTTDLIRLVYQAGYTNNVWQF